MEILIKKYKIDVYNRQRTETQKEASKRYC